jgi:hypothetical protein
LPRRKFNHESIRLGSTGSPQVAQDKFTRIFLPQRRPRHEENEIILSQRTLIALIFFVSVNKALMLRFYSDGIGGVEVSAGF